MRVLVLSPHTDDVELGAGGTICRLLEEGHELRWMVFSVAEESLPKGMPPDTLEKEFRASADSLGLAEESLTIFHHRVRRLHEVRQDVLESLLKMRNEFSPDLVIAPSRHDHHQDHQVVSQEAVRAFKTSASLICYELPWNHLEFDGTFFMRLDEKHMERKFELLGHYKSQMVIDRGYFDKDFIFGLARVRGVQCGATYAEAFEVLRWID